MIDHALANDVLDAFLDQDLLNQTITLGVDSTDNHFKFITTKGKFASNEVVAGGQGTDVVNSCTINWLYDGTAGVPTAFEISTTEGV